MKPIEIKDVVLPDSILFEAVLLVRFPLSERLCAISLKYNVEVICLACFRIASACWILGFSVYFFCFV